MALTLGAIATTLGNNISTQESNLNTAISSIGTDPSTKDLLDLQRATTTMSLQTDIQSTIIKNLADSMKSIVQKAG